MLLIGVLALAAGAAGSFAMTWLRQSVAGGAPVVADAPPQGRELLAVFAGESPTKAADCRCFATLCGSLADVIEFDGRQATPRLSRQGHLAELRQVSRELRLAGQSLGEKYPRLAGAIETFLDPLIPGGKGASAVEVTPDVRAKWVEGHRALSRAAEWAAGGL